MVKLKREIKRDVKDPIMGLAVVVLYIICFVIMMEALVIIVRTVMG